MVQRILNATVHESIGVSPAQLLFGNAIDLDRGLFTPLETHMFESDMRTLRQKRKSSKKMFCNCS